MNAKLTVLAVSALVLIGGYAVYSYATAPTKAPTGRTASAASAAPDQGLKTDDVPADGKFHILPARTTASFALNEILRGQPKTVVGTTHDVDGAIAANRAGLNETAYVGTIRINARTFVTDSEQRNKAVRRMILKTEDDANEFVVFTPKTIAGLPATAEIGQPFTFEITGDLLISGVTKETAFKGLAAFMSENEIAGNAETLLHYPDFGVSVPNLPFLANVDQDATLKLEFVAIRAGE